jgi:hypothetical protein
VITNEQQAKVTVLIAATGPQLEGVTPWIWREPQELTFRALRQAWERDSSRKLLQGLWVFIGADGSLVASVDYSGVRREAQLRFLRAVNQLRRAGHQPEMLSVPAPGSGGGYENRLQALARRIDRLEQRVSRLEDLYEDYS